VCNIICSIRWTSSPSEYVTDKAGAFSGEMRLMSNMEFQEIRVQGLLSGRRTANVVLLLVSALMITLAAKAAPAGASVSTVVQAPASMRTAPFDVSRSLIVPPDFRISVYARIPRARFMAVAPNGTPPYVLEGDSGGTILRWDPPAGNGTYQLGVTAKDGDTYGPAVDVTFGVVNGPQKIVRLSFINADSDQPVAGLHPIPNGAAISLSSLPSRNVTFQAFTSPATVGSVRFLLTGPVSRTAVESVRPYALMGDSGGNMVPMNPPFARGSYTLTETPYTGGSASGTAGTATRVSFTVVD
jgi:hypothetical protein